MTIAIEAIEHLIPLIVLISIRVGATMAALPAPFGSGAPLPVRAGIGLMISIAISMPSVELADELSMAPLALALDAVPELFVGAILGLTVRLSLAVAEVAGNAIGFTSGLAFAASVDPVSGESSPPTSRALNAFTIALFLTLEGHHSVLAALAASLESAPPGGALAAIVHEGIPQIGAHVMAAGLRIASPVVATMFLVQVGTALVSRAAPRVHLFALTFAIAVGAGLLTLYVSIPTIAPALAAEIHRIPMRLVEALGGR